MRWSWRLWPPVPWGGPERSRFRPGIAYTSRMIACRHDGTRDQMEALAALECPRCPSQRLAPYGPDDANLRICDCCPRIYQMPDNPKEPALPDPCPCAVPGCPGREAEAALAAMTEHAEGLGLYDEPRARVGNARTLVLNCPRCGAEVEFRVDSADVTVAAQTVAGRVHLLRADVDLTGGHTCEVEA